ncbi:MAG: hypothetical protein WDN45_14785 [Caulobacteraceae bacterium]
MQQGEQALLAEVAKLRDTPVGAAELDKAKTILIAQDLRQREPVYGRGFSFGYAHYVEGAGLQGQRRHPRHPGGDSRRRAARGPQVPVREHPGDHQLPLREAASRRLRQ